MPSLPNISAIEALLAQAQVALDIAQKGAEAGDRGEAIRGLALACSRISQAITASAANI